MPEIRPLTRQLRKIALLLLDDEYGISYSAWSKLREQLGEHKDCGDIICNVRCQDNMCYLPEDRRNLIWTNCISMPQALNHIKEVIDNLDIQEIADLYELLIGGCEVGVNECDELLYLYPASKEGGK